MNARIFVVLSCFLVPALTSAEPPLTIKMQGLLQTAGGGPVPDGTYGMTFALYANQEGGEPLYSDVDPAVTVNNGVFDGTIGDVKPFDGVAVMDGTATWVGVTVGGEPELPRVPFGWSPYAIHAMVAKTLDCTGCISGAHLADGILGDFVTAGTLSKVAETGSYGDLKNTPTLAQLDSLCPEGQVVQGLGADGSLNCIEAALSGELDMGDEKIVNLAPPTEGTDAANKAYVDDTVAGLSKTLTGLSGARQRYTVVLTLSSDQYCPAGWTLDDLAPNAGPNNLSYINIADSGLFIGGMDSPSYGQEYNYARVPVGGAGVTKLCWKTFESSSGNPQLLSLGFKGGNAQDCPESYHYVPKNALAGAGHNAWVQTTSAGAFIGYTDSNASASSTATGDGYAYRYYSDQVDTVCFKVVGVDDDPATAKGVFPVFLGLKSPNDCPSGWEARSSGAVDGTNSNFYLQITDSATLWGGLNSWSHGGDNYIQIQWSSEVEAVCWKMFTPSSARPFYTVRTPVSGNCPAGYLGFNAGSVKGNNNNGYIAGTGHGLYMGGLGGWSVVDYSDGYIQHNFTSQASNKVCLKIDGVE